MPKRCPRERGRGTLVMPKWCPRKRDRRDVLSQGGSSPARAGVFIRAKGGACAMCNAWCPQSRGLWCISTLSLAIGH
jgi:hypothetical protein